MTERSFAIPTGQVLKPYPVEVQIPGRSQQRRPPWERQAAKRAGSIRIPPAFDPNHRPELVTYRPSTVTKATTGTKQVGVTTDAKTANARSSPRFHASGPN
ncbi:hypothetical protein ACYOEI_32740 [Singulisphaera rosea]